MAYYLCNGIGDVGVNRTTSTPISVLRYDVDKGLNLVPKFNIYPSLKSQINKAEVKFVCQISRPPCKWCEFGQVEWHTLDVCRYKLAVPCLDVFKATLDIFQISPVSLSRFKHKTFIK